MFDVGARGGARSDDKLDTCGKDIMVHTFTAAEANGFASSSGAAYFAPLFTRSFVDM